MSRLIPALLLLWLLAAPALADEVDVDTAQGEAGAHQGHGLGHRLLLYLPNRVFDVLDLARVRARVGPGLALSVRATEAVDVFVGSYVSAFAGLPGPRGKPRLPWPVGLESKSGLELSVVDATTGGVMGPGYAPVEFGAGAQLLLLGLDVGVAPLQALDFAAGLLFLDPAGDDL